MLSREVKRDSIEIKCCRAKVRSSASNSVILAYKLEVRSLWQSCNDVTC